AADGSEHIVATRTAHNRSPSGREYLKGARAQLQNLVRESPRTGLGCAFHLSYDNLQEVLVRPGRYTIDDTKYLLVELSNYSVPPQIGDHLVRLADNGLVPILTHPERNPIMQKSPQRVLEWVERGLVVQVTASAFTGDWGDSTRRSALWLLEREAVHVLASDAHDTQH